MRGGENTLAGSLRTTDLARSKEPHQIDRRTATHRFTPLAGRAGRFFLRILTAVCEHATCIGGQGNPPLPVTFVTVEKRCGYSCPS